jgi:hypothetical protein
MSGAATDLCPRCGGSFHCGVDDAGRCACTGITLGAALQQQLRAHFTGCLCLRCLQALAAGAPLHPASREALGRGAGNAAHNRRAASAAEDDAA